MHILDWLVIDLITFFARRPILASFLMMILIAGSVFGVIKLNKLDQERLGIKHLESQHYQRELNKLNQTESNIKELLAFVDTQKASLQKTEELIATLKSENKKLEPIVKMKRSTVEDLFRVQDERVRNHIWHERWIGFFFGIAASLVASFLMLIINKVREL